MTVVRRFGKAVVWAALFVALLSAPVSAAIVTLPFSEFGNGLVVVNFDYNEGNGNILRFRCINNSDQAAWFGVYLVENGTETLVGERICNPHETITQNIPGVTMAWDLVDGGIMMGNYQFRARWPAYRAY